MCILLKAVVQFHLVALKYRGAAERGMHTDKGFAEHCIDKWTANRLSVIPSFPLPPCVHNGKVVLGHEEYFNLQEDFKERGTAHVMAFGYLMMQKSIAFA